MCNSHVSVQETLDPKMGNHVPCIFLCNKKEEEASLNIHIASLLKLAVLHLSFIIFICRSGLYSPKDYICSASTIIILNDCTTSLSSAV